MRIIRTHIKDNGNTDTSVIKENATREEWMKLQNRMWSKSVYSAYGKPNLTNWKTRSILTTSAGHTFEFKYVS